MSRSTPTSSTSVMPLPAKEVEAQQLEKQVAHTFNTYASSFSSSESEPCLLNKVVILKLEPRYLRGFPEGSQIGSQIKSPKMSTSGTMGNGMGVVNKVAPQEKSTLNTQQLQPAASRKRQIGELFSEIETPAKRVKQGEQTYEAQVGDDLDPLDPIRLTLLFQQQNKAQFNEILDLRAKVASNTSAETEVASFKAQLQTLRSAFDGAIKERDIQKDLANERLETITNQYDAIRLFQKMASAQEDSSKYKEINENLKTQLRHCQARVQDEEESNENVAIAKRVVEAKLQAKTIEVVELEEKMALLNKARISARSCSDKNKNTNERLREELKSEIAAKNKTVKEKDDERANRDQLERNRNKQELAIKSLRVDLEQAYRDKTSIENKLEEERKEMKALKENVEKEGHFIEKLQGFIDSDGGGTMKRKDAK